MFDSLNLEQRLLLLTSRLTFTQEEKDLIREYSCNKKINWFEFFKMAIYHKTATLCWNNINTIVPDVVMPTYLFYMMRYCKKEISRQNRMFIEEFNMVTKALTDNEIVTVPVKGSRFVKTLYGCSGTRFMGDLDLLVYKKDGKRIKKTMNALGYVQGKIDFKNLTVEPLSRAEEIKWKMSVSNFAPYVRLTGDELNPFFKFDFRHSLDDNLENESIAEILNYKEINGDARPAHLFVHLCTHFYGEAKRTVSIFFSKDFNIIKLTDIREFVKANMDCAEWDEVIRFTKKYNFTKHVYFTLHILNLLFADGYEEEIIERLGIEDLSFIDSFGDNTLDEKYISRRTLTERIFACDNAEEIYEKPSFLVIDDCSTATNKE